MANVDQQGGKASAIGSINLYRSTHSYQKSINTPGMLFKVLFFQGYLEKKQYDESLATILYLKAELYGWKAFQFREETVNIWTLTPRYLKRKSKKLNNCWNSHQSFSKSLK